MHSFRQIAITVFLLTSLLAGSAAACACSHHQPKPVHTTASCHGGMEAAQADDSADSDSDCVDSHCECFVKASTPFVLAKQDNKKSKAADKTAVIADVDQTLDLATVETTEQSSQTFSTRPFLTRTLSNSLRSRAPPRL